MRVLITQPAPEAAASARALSARGHEAIAIPLVMVERESAPQINLANAQAFLAVSPEGVRALAEHVGVRTFPIFVDSDLTAAEARRVGFKEVLAAKDDSQDLARLIERTLKPANGALIYACSTAAPVNLPAMLGNMGFAVRALPLYSIKRVAEMPRELREKLAGKAIDVALFLSPDEARAFVTLLQRDETAPSITGLKTVSATPAVAAPLRALKGTSITVAPASDPDSVWATLDGDLVDKVEEERKDRERRAKEEEGRRRTEEERLRKEEVERARIAREKAETERIAREKADAERAAAVQAAAEQAELERLAREEEQRIRAEDARKKREQDERERAEKLAREKTERERIAAERAAADAAERERLALERAARESAKAEEAARAKAEKERLAAERAARDAAERQQREKDRLESERIKAEEAERQRVENERLATARAEQDRLRKEKDELERAENAERERRRQEREAIERAEAERIEKEARAEQARLRKEKEERELAERIELDRLSREKYERERAERLRQDAEDAAREKAEREQRARERDARTEAERERLAAERVIWEEAERVRIAAARAERDRLEAERGAREQAAREVWEKERAEKERIAREKAEHVRAENARLAAEREKERLARAEAARLEKEQRAEAARLEKEQRAEAERVEKEKRAEAARVEKEKREEAERLEKERRAEAARIENERLAQEKAEHERIAADRAREEAERKRIAREKAAAQKAEQDRIAAEQAQAEAERKRIAREKAAVEKAEQDRVAAEQARAEAEQKRIAREEAAARKAKDDQARREEHERLARAQAERRTQELEEEAKAKAERKRLAEEQKCQLRAEKARRAAELPQRPGWARRLGVWFAKTNETAEPPPDPRWSMVVSLEEPVTVTPSAVASAEPSWNDRPMTDPIRDPEEPREPAAQPSPKADTGEATLIGRVPLALMELNELVERENAASRSRDSVAPPPESLADARPAARSGGGRSARMLVEDAADDRARDRLRNWGRGDQPASEAPPDPEALDAPIPETMTMPIETRRGPMRTIALFFVLAAIATAALMTTDRWMPLLTHDRPTPVVTAPSPAPAPQVKPAAPATPATTSTPAAPPPAAGTDTALSNQAIAALMARVGTLEAALGTTARVDEVNRRVDALEGKSANASSVLALAERVTALEQANRSAADARAVAVALTIAATQWRDAVVTGRSFLKEWDTVKALGGKTPPDAAFAKYASTGLPTLPELQQKFDATAAATVRASYLSDDTAGWLRQALDRVFSLVTIRRTDVDTGNDVEAVLVRAERAVDAGDLEGAVAEMKKLTGASLLAATPWVELAEACVRAEQAAHETVIEAAAALAAPQAQAAPAGQKAE